MLISSSLLFLLFALCALVLVATNSFKPRMFLGACGFLIPLVSINGQIGVNLFLHQLVGVLGLLLLGLAPGARLRRGIYKPVSRLVLYVVLLTTIWMSFEYALLERYHLGQTLGLGPGQTTYKMPVQLLGLLAILAAFLIIPTRAKKTRDVRVAYYGFILGCMTSSFLGLFFGLTTGRGMIGTRASANVELQSAAISRVGGLSGEPKHLGAFLVIAMALLLAVYSFGEARLLAKRAGLVFLVLLVPMVFTLSTSAWIGLVGVILVHLLLIRQWQGQKRHPSRKSMIYLVIASGVILASQSSVGHDIFQARIENRILDRETSEIDSSKNSLVWDVYSDHPQFLPTGFGSGGFDLEATPYVLKSPKYAAQLQYVRTPTPSTTGLQMLGDIGLIGLILLTLIATKLSATLKSAGQPALACFCLTGFVGAMLISINALPAYLFLAGGAFAVLRITSPTGRTEDLGGGAIQSVDAFQ